MTFFVIRAMGMVDCDSWPYQKPSEDSLRWFFVACVIPISPNENALCPIVETQNLASLFVNGWDVGLVYCADA